MPPLSKEYLNLASRTLGDRLLSNVRNEFGERRSGRNLADRELIWCLCREEQYRYRLGLLGTQN